MWPGLVVRGELLVLVELVVVLELVVEELVVEELVVELEDELELVGEAEVEVEVVLVEDVGVDDVELVLEEELVGELEVVELVVVAVAQPAGEAVSDAIVPLTGRPRLEIGVPTGTLTLKV